MNETLNQETKRKRGRPRKNPIAIETAINEVADSKEMAEIEAADLELAKKQIEALTDEIGPVTKGKKSALDKADEKLLNAAAARVNSIKLEQEAKALAKQLQDQGYSKDQIAEQVSAWKAENRKVEKLTRSDLQEILMNATPSREDYRTLTDLFYQHQKTRIRLSNQISAVINGKDNQQLQLDMLYYAFSLTSLMEQEIGKVLGYMSERTVEGRWLLKVNGIGPTLACMLLAYLDIDKAPHIGNFISYAGLNDNNRPKITGSEATEIISRYAHKNVISPEDILLISNETQWPLRAFDYINEKGNGAPIINNGEIVGYNAEAVRNIIVRPPYSKKLKVTMYKIGDQFMKLQNKPRSLYGRFVRERKIYELAKNAKFEYADQAKAILERFNFSKATKAYEAYSKGQLPAAHINQRCNRYATKIFMSHLHSEMMFVKTNGAPPELPWIIEFGGHKDYIEPEVPFTLE